MCSGNEIICESDVKEMESVDCSENEEDDCWKELVVKV